MTVRGVIWLLAVALLGVLITAIVLAVLEAEEQKAEELKEQRRKSMEEFFAALRMTTDLQEARDDLEDPAKKSGK